MTIADHKISILENFQRGNPGERDIGEIVLVEFPYNLFVGCYFKKYE